MAQKLKVEKADVLKKELKDYRNFIFANYRGMNVKQMSGLRNALREKEVHFHVVKNRLVKRVFDSLEYNSKTHEFLADPTALTYFNSDVSEIAKLLVDSSAETSLEIKGGLIDGAILSSEDIINISKLPSRLNMIAQLVGLMNAPISSFIFVFSGVLLKFMGTLKAIEEKKAQS